MIRRATCSKTVVGVSPPWVRIPPSPPGYCQLTGIHHMLFRPRPFHKVSRAESVGWVKGCPALSCLSHGPCEEQRGSVNSKQALCVFQVTDSISLSISAKSYTHLRAHETR